MAANLMLTGPQRFQIKHGFQMFLRKYFWMRLGFKAVESVQ